jgi:hypothetical protein
MTTDRFEAIANDQESNESGTENQQVNTAQGVTHDSTENTVVAQQGPVTFETWAENENLHRAVHLSFYGYEAMDVEPQPSLPTPQVIRDEIRGPTQEMEPFHPLSYPQQQATQYSFTGASQSSHEASTGALHEVAIPSFEERLRRSLYLEGLLPYDQSLTGASSSSSSTQYSSPSTQSSSLSSQSGNLEENRLAIHNPFYQAPISQGQNQNQNQYYAEPLTNASGFHGRPTRLSPFDFPQPGLPQNGLPQPGYPQNGLPQSGLPQTGYPQPGYPQNGLYQPGFPQPGHPQNGFPQHQQYNPIMPQQPNMMPQQPNMMPQQPNMMPQQPNMMPQQPINDQPMQDCPQKVRCSAKAKAPKRRRKNQTCEAPVEGRHKCEACSKPFIRPSALGQHKVVHTKEKPYQCPLPSCPRHKKGNWFGVKSNRTRHVKSVHKDQAVPEGPCQCPECQPQPEEDDDDQDDGNGPPPGPPPDEPWKRGPRFDGPGGSGSGAGAIAV